MTLIGHAALGAGVFGVALPRRATLWGMTRGTLLACCLLLPMLPDADVLMHIWVQYGHPLGHRGFTHSLLFAFVVGVAVAWLLARLGKLARTRGALVKASALFITLLASHALTDAMTTGGKAPLLLWPISIEGQWAPSRIIPVSPMGKSLLRTEWSDDQLRSAAARRSKLLRGTARTHWLVRDVVQLSDRPDHARRLQVLGVALTELLYMAPLAVLAALLAVWRRRQGPPGDAPELETSARGPPGETASSWTPPRWWRARWWRGSLYLTGALALTLAGALSYARTLDAGIEVSRGTLPDALQTPYVRVAPAAMTDDAPVAVLVHGWRCSHQMMLPLARVLARNGVEAYAVDLPGHASSPIPLDASCPSGHRAPCRADLGQMFTSSLVEVLAGMRAAGMLAGREVALVGHSSGGIAVAELELLPPDQPDARVVLEGALERLRPGRNQLFVGRAGKIKKYPNAPVDRTAGSFEDGTAWRATTINIPHLAFVRHRGTNRALLDWIAQATGVELGADTRHHYNTYVATSLLAAGVGSFGWIALLGFGRRRGWLPRTEPAPARGWIALLCVLFGGLAAALWAGEWFWSGWAWQMARLRQTALIYLALASVTVAAPYLALAWRPRATRWGTLARDALIGLAGTVVLLGGYAAVANAYYFHALFAPWRLLTALGWGLALVPVTLVVREVGPRQPSPRAQALALLARVLTWAALLEIHAIGRGASGASEVMAMLGVLAIAELFSISTEVLLRSRVAPAVTIAFTLAWVQVALYPALVSSTV
ncbi:MAG: metal-dependent hydrolase [Myxococcales bacterium]|nr:metal-dependent hydrolase [Myxococcales bacterium]